MSATSDTQKSLHALAQGLASTTEGIVVSQDWDNRLVTVNVGGREQTMPWALAAPWPGNRVRVLTAGKDTFCLVVDGAALGEVLEVDSNIARVLGDDGVEYSYPCDVGVTVGWRVELSHRGRRVAGRYLVEPADSEFVVQAPPPAAGAQNRTFYPIDSANWWGGGSRWDTQNVEISSTRSGFYFYGTQIADSIPDTATITGAGLFLSENWDRVAGTPSRLGYHAAPTRPGSPPALTGALNVFDSGWVNIADFANALKTGAGFGVGFATGFGWRQFGPYTVSGAINITWT